MQNFNKIRGIIKMACYCLFNTVLNKLFHLTDIYIFSTRQNNNWVYKYDTAQKFAHPWILILYVVSTAVFLFCDSCSSLVPSQFNCLPFFRKKPGSCTFFGFPASSAYLNPFQQWLYDFEIHCFTWKTIGVLIHRYYKRWKHLQMLKKATQCIKSQRGETFWIGWSG